MNANFLAVIRRIIAEQGEAILADPARLKGFVADYAPRESKAERITFSRCIEYGAYTELKNAPDATARQTAKAAVARRVNTNEAIDMAMCNDALDALEAALFGEEKPEKARCLRCGRELEAGMTECPFCGSESAAPQPETPPEIAAPESPPFETTIAYESKPSSITSSNLSKQPVENHTGRNVFVVALLLAVVIMGVSYLSSNQGAFNNPSAVETNHAQEQPAPERDINGLTPADYDENGWAKKDGKWVPSPDGARYSAPAVNTELPQVRIVNNTGFLVYDMYVVAVPAQYWGDDKLGSTLPNSSSVSIRLPSSSTNRYGIRLKDLDGDTYTKWNIPISNNQTITFTIEDMDID
jgi:hypothetical protein